MQTQDELFLDVSELESPAPLHAILSALATNTGNKIVIVKHRIEPKGLYPYLENLNCLHECDFRDGFHYIKIWKNLAN